MISDGVETLKFAPRPAPDSICHRLIILTDELICDHRVPLIHEILE